MIKKYTAIAMIAASSLILAGCGDENKDKIAQIAKDDIKTWIDDPDAAKFSEIKVVDISGEKREYMVCGVIDSKDERGKDYHNEFASFVYFNRQQQKWLTIPEPRYSFVDGLLNKEFYVKKVACTDGVKAYEKKLNESLKNNEE